MSDKGEELGRSITRAACFLGQTYQDTSQLLAALDGLMADRSWQPTEKTRTSWALSNGMNPKKWLLDYLLRWYVPTDSLQNILSLIAFFIRFAPPRAFDQPMVLGAAAAFPAPARYKVLKKHWRKRWRDFDSVVEALGEKSGPHLLMHQEVNTLLPGASQVTCMVIPLCQLTGADALVSLCVEPILAALPTVGN